MTIYDAERLSLVNRMLSYASKRSSSAEQAMDEVKQHLPQGYGKSVQTIDHMLHDQTPQGQDRPGAAGRFGIFESLAQVVRAEGGDVQRLFIGGQEGLRNAAAKLQDYWGGFKSLFIYFLGVIFVALVVVPLFMVKVLPTFRDSFTSYQLDLPEFTAFLLGNTLLWTVLVAVLIAFALLCIGLAIHVKSRVGQLQPFSGVLRNVPGIKYLDEVYRYFLFLRYAQALREANLEDGTAVANAQSLAGVRSNRPPLVVYRDGINVATKLGALAEELNFQVDQVDSLFESTLINVRESLTLGAQLSLGILIGAFILAMYLPIFMLGSVI